MFHALAAAAIAVFFAHPALALTVEEAVATGLKNNPELQAFRLEEEAARGQLVKAQLPLPSNPVIDAAGSRRDRPRDEGTGKYTNYSMTLSQEIEVAGQRGLRMDVAEKNLARVVLEIRDRERSLTYEVKNGFALVLAARKRVELASQVARLQQELLDFTRTKFNAGEVSALQVNLAEVEYSRARKEIVSARREHRERLAGLRAAMGIVAETALDVEGEMRPEIAGVPDKQGLRQTLLQRPDIRAASAELEQRHTTEKLIAREAVPNVVAGGFYDRNEARNETGALLSVAIPLFDRKQGERRQARARAEQARVKRMGLEQAIDREFDVNYSNLLSTQQELSLFEKEIIARSLENLDLLNLAFKEGKISFFDVRIAQRETFEVQFAYLDALLRAEQAIYALERTTGGTIR